MVFIQKNPLSLGNHARHGEADLLLAIEDFQNLWGPWPSLGPLGPRLGASMIRGFREGFEFRV